VCDERDEWNVISSSKLADVVGFSFTSGPCITCDGCNKERLSPNDRHKCAICPDYDLCTSCFNKRSTIHSHHDSWRQFGTQDGQHFQMPAAEVPIGVPPPAEAEEPPAEVVTFDSLRERAYQLGIDEKAVDGAINIDDMDERKAALSKLIAAQEAEKEQHQHPEVPEKEQHQHAEVPPGVLECVLYGQPELASCALARLLNHSDEAVRAAAHQAIIATVSEAPVPTPSEEDMQDGLEAQTVASDSPSFEIVQPEEFETESERDAPTERSAKVIDGSMAFVNSAHAIIDLADARGDVTDEFSGLLSQYSEVKQAFRLGRLAVHHGEPEAGAVATVVVTNTGSSDWPKVSELRVVAGPAYGLTELPLGPVPAGDTVEMLMDFSFGPGEAGEAALSAWAMIDAHGQPFGPLLVLEVTRI